MKVLAQRYGLLLVCQNCHTLLSYKAVDVYEGKYVYCPVCNEKNRVNIEEQKPDNRKELEL